MKTEKTILGILAISALIFISCGTAKRGAVSCTEFPVYKSHKASFRNHTAVLNLKESRFKKSITGLRKNHNKNAGVVRSDEYGKRLAFPNTLQINKIEYSRGLIASTENTVVPLVGNSWAENLLIRPDQTVQMEQENKCDTIVLKSGTLIPCKISEIDLNVIRYRKCDYLEGPVITVAKTDIIALIYANGTSEAITTPEQYVITDPAARSNNASTQPVVTPSNPYVYTNPNPQFYEVPKETKPSAILSFLSSMVGLFVASIPLGIVAVILGATAIGKINRDPKRYKGRGLAIAGIIVGFVEIVLMLAILSSMNGSN